MAVCEDPSLSLLVLEAEVAGTCVHALREADHPMTRGVLARYIPVAVFVGADDLALLWLMLTG